MTKAQRYALIELSYFHHRAWVNMGSRCKPEMALVSAGLAETTAKKGTRFFRLTHRGRVEAKAAR